MPKPILPELGTCPCPTCNGTAAVKKNKRRHLFGYCKYCGKFCEQNNTYVLANMVLAHEHASEAPESAPAQTQPTAPAAPDSTPPAQPEGAAHKQIPIGGAIPWL